MASSERPVKRVRLNAGAHRDQAPLPTNLHDVQLREAPLRRVGPPGAVLQGPVVRAPNPQIPSTWDALQSWAPHDDPEYNLDPEDGALADTETTLDRTTPRKKYLRSRVSKRPHVVWKDVHRQTYLEELMRWEGRGEFSSSSCVDCLARRVPSPGPAKYRCAECFLPDLVCSGCCVKRHRSNPLHRIEYWDGTFFAKVSLKSLGLVIQLNHATSPCDNPVRGHKSFRVLHLNGIHDVAIQYCDCLRKIPRHLQLLRRHLYPASQITIRTCATFELLRHLHTLALTTKSNTYDFYRALEKLTRNDGIEPPIYRYKALMRMVIQWRHLKLLKRGGRGNEPTGVAGTAKGELAVMCPSCPRPGVNLPDEWEKAPPALKFLYVLILCMDANFRLKNQMVSNYSQDPGLGVGWAYMLPRPLYEQYVLSRASDADISTCVGFQALAKANTKFSKGLRYTGVSLVACGRSEMIMPAGVGNLQKGERYANMDYAFGSTLTPFALIPLILISYDICCQWFINLHKRMTEHWPTEITPPATTKFIPAIPKMHEPAHGKANHQMYSLNYIPGVGQSDLEAPERIWSPHNVLGNATKTQGPGSRHDVIDDHFNFWNYAKYISLGDSLAKRYRVAVAERNIQVEGHRGLTASLTAEQVEKWETVCKDWEDAPFPKSGVKNPYHVEGLALTETQVRAQLHLEEEQNLANGGESLHTTTPSAFIMHGLDLEDTQRRIKRLAQDISSGATSRQSAGLTEQRNLFRSRLRTWEQVLPIYMPGLLQYQADLEEAERTRRPTTSSSSSNSNSSAQDLIENAVIWLPSKVATQARRRVCREGLPRIEERLRTVQMEDSLENVRHILKVKTRMVQFKNKNLRGQREGTRSRTIIDRVHSKARAAANKYNDAREAKLQLSGDGDWTNAYQYLKDSDIRSYQDPNRLQTRIGRRGTREDDEVEEHITAEPPGSNVELFGDERTRRDGTGESRRTLSWIWLDIIPSANDGMLDEEDEEDITLSEDILQAEWAKSRARANRWTEEVMLLGEEMRRTLSFLRWRAQWWDGKPFEWEGVTPQLKEGMRAYAHSQAKQQRDLGVHFKRMWENPLKDVSGHSQPNSTSNTNIDNGNRGDGDGDDNDDDDDGVDDDDDDDDDDEEEEEEDGVGESDEDEEMVEGEGIAKRSRR